MLSHDSVLFLVVFWDYDTQWGGDRSRSAGGPKNWGGLEFENTERLLEIHAQYNIPACFAVVGSAALSGQRPYHDPGQIRRIYAFGHEVASHGFRHDWIPGMDRKRLREDLRDSKDALEQCIGAPVTSFVPPYNQPWDCPGRFSFSFSERREAGPCRTDLRGLCEALREEDYRCCRVSYWPIWRRLLGSMGGQWHRRGKVESIAGISCIRLNTGCGFDGPVLARLSAWAGRPGIIAVYGHPHSLHAGNTQDERFLRSFCEAVVNLRALGRLRVVLPRQLSGQVEEV